MEVRLRSDDAERGRARKEVEVIESRQPLNRAAPNSRSEMSSSMDY